MLEWILSVFLLNEGTASLIEAHKWEPNITTRTGGIENIVIENKTALISELTI